MGEKERQKFIADLIGKPWQANAKGPDAFDCWHLAVYVQRHLFNRAAPDIVVPEHPTWSWMISQFKSHPELNNWVELLQPANGLIYVKDGAIVLMARNTHPAHCGVYLQGEGGVLHCDDGGGVMFQDIMTLKCNSWAKLRFYEPR